MNWACKTVIVILAMLTLTGLMSPTGWADAESLRLNTKVDEATVSNLDNRSMRVVADMQYPGLHEWKRWRVKALHPETGEIMTCRRNGPDDCRRFPSYADYTTFRIGQWQASERTKFRWYHQ